MSSKWLVGTVCVALLLYAIGALPPIGPVPVTRAEAPVVEASAPSAEEYARDYAAFGRQLAEFCSGDGSNRATLKAIAQRLAARHGRKDALDVFEYYAVLSADDRARGLAAYAEVDGFHERAEGWSAEDWRRERPRLLADIEAFVARTLPAPEYTAAGNALALASEIRVDWLAARGASTQNDGPSDTERQERLERARREALEALALFERAGLQTPKLRPMLQLGRLAVLEAREAEAREHFEACLALARHCRREEYQVDALVALIHMARSAGDQPELEARLMELAQLRTPEESWELAREHSMLWLHRDEPGRAAEFLLRHRPDGGNDLRVWRQILTTARLRMGDLAGAQQLFASIEKPGPDGDEDWILLRSTLDLALGEHAAVIYRLRESRDVVAAFSERGQSRAAVLLGEAHLQNGEPSLALAALGRGRTLAEGWEARMEEARPSASTGATVLGEWLGMHAVVLEAKALCQLDRPLDAAVLIERAHGLRWRNAARADQLSPPQGVQSLSPEDLRQWAKHHDLGLITWISGADDALAIHVGPDGDAHHKPIPLSRRELHRAIQRFREALIRGDRPRQDQLGRELSAALLPASLREVALGEGVAPPSLLLLAHGRLELLPFEALPHGEDVLDDHFVLLALPELPSNRPGHRGAGEHPWTLLGDPVDQEGAQRLPGAGDELTRLEQSHPEVTRISGPALTGEALLQAMAAGDSIHIATHLAPFETCSSPRFSAMGLELSWGESLCATEIAQQTSTSDLVVLATCASAGGRHLDGRGVQGIARAFLDSGTRNLLVTLWPIRDDIVSRFSLPYHEALRGGANPAAAARQARRLLAAEGIAPVDWAAFRAIGRE